MKRTHGSRSVATRLLSLARWLVFALAALAFNLPVIATLVTAFKSDAELSESPGLWVHAPTLEHFRQVLTITERLNIYDYLLNSLIASLIGTLLPIVLALPAAHVMVRKHLGRRWLLPLVANLRAMPLIIFAIPLYMAYQAFGLLDTRLGLGLILAVVNLPLTLMLCVNAIAEIPLELEEAAQLDGASSLRILRSLVLPLCRPMLATIFVFGFITAWNEFLFGLMLTTKEAIPINVAASFFFASGGGGVQWGLAAAVILIACIPPAVLGLWMNRQISASMFKGALKG